jgi:hypothetical protein
MRLRIYCWLGLACYVVLSVTDLLFTSALLKGNCEAYESNPVAAAFLERHGLRGLALYKIGGVVVFLGSVALLARRRPKMAAALVTFGCSVILSVVVYSHALIREARATAEQEAASGVEWPAGSSGDANVGFDLPEWCNVAIR